MLTYDTCVKKAMNDKKGMSFMFDYYNGKSGVYSSQIDILLKGQEKFAILCDTEQKIIIGPNRKPTGDPFKLSLHEVVT